MCFSCGFSACIQRSYIYLKNLEVKVNTVLSKNWWSIQEVISVRIFSKTWDIGALFSRTYSLQIISYHDSNNSNKIISSWAKQELYKAFIFDSFMDCEIILA